ncbi:hypothetical protein NY2A_B744L [Paramecium bursaria Chlorella virus NY2A]|uniref:tRNA(Ile)-lysidine synthetase n=1 Tax=Paramecium bursaria Chlorella virus NY2A TaxID=46021 RepID=A7IXR9_PBCVN|nr:hypothetical protein NY2A_B744L [Paramecium bursaria Chlorella virus NY2A]ABT15143.1 hypothetical protein NY2A_B744L [Paramecium bursaria Chlorella virus NY2A]
MSLSEFISEFLSNENFWFTQNTVIDEYLTIKYEHLLDEDYYDTDNPHHIVILFDQLPRHVFRKSQSNHIIEYFLSKSLMFFDRTDLTKLPDLEWCFTHLCIRHTKDPIWIHRVIKNTWTRLIPGCHEFVHRFLKASYERCPMENQSPFIHTTYRDTIYDAMKHAHTTYFTPNDYALKINRDNHVVKAVEKALRDVKPSEITMSLSGGVDSMTLFHILDGLRGFYGYKMNVAMVNYTNRACAYDEEYFVTDWANWLGYPISVRRIEEINRKPCIDANIRTLYETYTRKVRYNTYKSISHEAFVAMGHNKDDCLENILQNICSGHKYDNLAGIVTVVKQDDNNFFRPLLDVSKDEIIAYARYHNIPYLPNSTPAHFKRGMVRNFVVPCMNDWDERFIPGLFKLKDSMMEMDMMMEIIAKEFVNKFEDNVAIIDELYIMMGQTFWKSVLNKLFPGEVFKNKMISYFVESLRRFDGCMNFELNKNVKIGLTKKRVGIAIKFKCTDDSY